MITEHLSQEERDELSRKRLYAIPFELVDEAHEYAVFIDDTCIEALLQKIQEKKALLYVTSFLKKERSSTNNTRTSTPK